MTDKRTTDVYDDENVPKVDLPHNSTKDSVKNDGSAEPLPESFRPRKDGPGGE